MSSYAERERRRAVELRDRLLGDPGGGSYRTRPYPFVLMRAEANLWEGARAEATAYFGRHGVAWHGGGSGSMGHLLSSQVACVNHLAALRGREDAATALLQALDPEVERAEPVPEGRAGKLVTEPGGFVAFEFVGPVSRLGEGQELTRGANCTSVDAAMIGRRRGGGRRLFLIEWKYVESYRFEDKYLPNRAARYDHLILQPDSPFVAGLEPRALYVEPFYQMMRQTLLGWQVARHRDLGCDGYAHVHVVPEANREFHERVTSPGLEARGRTVGEAWRSVLKEPARYLSVTPEALLAPVAACAGTGAHLAYLRERYWAGSPTSR